VDSARERRVIEEAQPDTKGFADTLAEFRHRAGFSRLALANHAGVNPSYLTRIELGEREPPRIHILEALARLLRLTNEEWDELYTVAGHRAPSIERMGGWHPVLSAITNVMNDEALSMKNREDFALTVETMARHWH
jgi:transcriptional regulator with XRE-family HTH domain